MLFVILICLSAYGIVSHTAYYFFLIIASSLQSKKVDLNLPKTHAAYSKLQDLNKAESKKKKKQHVYSAEEMRGVFFELLQLEAPTRTDAKVLFKKLVAFASVNVANTDFSEYHFWPAPEVKNDSDGQVQGDNNGNSTGQEPGGKELALDGFGFSVGPVETAAETAATSVAARPTAPTRKEKVGTVSKKTFLKVCTRIIVEYRQICVVEDTHIDVWASGREGYRASDVEKLWRTLAMDDTTRLDQDTFVHWLIVKEDSAAGDQGATGKGGKKGKKGAAAAAAASPKKKAKKKKGKNRGNPNAKHKEKKRKHASPEYKLLTVKEPKLQDFAGEILLNHLRVNEGKEIFSEPPLTHWDEATEKLKGVQDSGYGQLLFLINKTRVRAVIWTDADSGPVLFVSFVTMLSSRSTSRWLYHAKLFFDRSEKLSHIETRSIRTFIDGYLYDSENIEDFENWTKYVRGEGEHDYHLLRDVPT
jgi:hypothetical protein